MNRRDSHPIRVVGWIAVVAMLGLAVLGPSASATLGAGPGDNGTGQPTGGPRSNITIGGSLSAAANIATIGSAVLACDGNAATGVSGSFTLSTDVDAGSTIVVYLVPNNGSDATPEANVSMNYTVVDVEQAGTYDFTIPITHGFTTTQGGILAVFAVNADGTTVISSSKSNSLNCTEATSTPTTPPTPTGGVGGETATPTLAPTATPTGGVGGETATPPASPTGGVEGATGTPTTTLPPTDIAGNGSSPTSGGWRLLLLGLAGLLASALLLAPSPRRIRR